MKDERIERLDDYVRGVLPEDAARAYEEELFAAALEGDGAALESYDVLVRTLQQLGDRGTLPAYLSPEAAAELRARYGDRVCYREVTDEPEQRIVIPRSAEFLLTYTKVDLEGIDRVDIEIEVPGMGPIKTMPDVQFTPGSDGIYGFCEATLAQQTTDMPIITRCWGHGKAGKRLLHESLVVTALGD